jgi:hypothetical protein
MNRTLAVAVKVLDEDDPAVLHRHYPQQLNQQPCVLKLDLVDGSFWADYNPEIGNSVPARMWHGVVQSWAIPCLTAAATNQLLQDLSPLAQRVLDGGTVEWDGNNNVGVLNESAAAAAAEIIDVIESTSADYECVYEMDAGVWWSEGDLPEALTADTTDEELASIAADEEGYASTNASNDGYTVLLGADEFLAARREEMREAVREQLAEVAGEHARLEKRRNELIVRLTSWGDSSRDISNLVGLSHVAVQKIAKRTVGGDQDTDAAPA